MSGELLAFMINAQSARSAEGLIDDKIVAKTLGRLAPCRRASSTREILKRDSRAIGAGEAVGVVEGGAGDDDGAAAARATGRPAMALPPRRAEADSVRTDAPVASFGTAAGVSGADPANP